MPKFRKKPVVIDAVQYKTGMEKMPDGVCIDCQDVALGSAHIHTAEGIMCVDDGDWIITGIKGEKYPCKPDIFEKTYEEVQKAKSKT